RFLSALCFCSTQILQNPQSLSQIFSTAPMKPIVVILNPKARSERAQALVDEVVRLSTRAVVRVTEQAGGAWLMAQQAVAEGFDTVVAAGGDGTINEVVNGLAGTNATL